MVLVLLVVLTTAKFAPDPIKTEGLNFILYKFVVELDDVDVFPPFMQFWVNAMGFSETAILLLLIAVAT